ncbi:hypothetical protein D0Z07_4216 [Hyphodiscus hymeniophilus]|uniref:Uncharacterized protein n=1 Tax=Hyphodiscus hymeniophilus TaxID=353542 RepID=A0A9P6VK32_9HELO|nr:hypothetical protein D0Z07_4216 [Hyphodiscus hymeniophilus]
MPNGFPGFPQSTFPNDQPPSLFHPASPKFKAAQHVKDADAASMASTSTFASTVSLLKENVKAKFLPKDKNARKGSAASEEKTASPRAQTAEDYRILATMKY